MGGARYAHLHTQARFKFLFDGYEERFSWWEALVLLRKFLLSCILVFFRDPLVQGSPAACCAAAVTCVCCALCAADLWPPPSTTPPPAAAVVASWVVVGALMAHLWWEPYNSPFLNRLDASVLLITYVRALHVVPCSSHMPTHCVLLLGPRACVCQLHAQVLVGAQPVSSRG